jgi:hypothetical protein
LLTDYLKRGATITAKYYVAFLKKLKQPLVSKHRGKLLMLLFLQDNVDLHKAAITHKKLADLHFEVMKRLELAPSDYTSFLTSTNTSREDSFRALRRHIGLGRVVCSTAKRIFAGWIKELSHQVCEAQGEICRVNILF